MESRKQLVDVAMQKTSQKSAKNIPKKPNKAYQKVQQSTPKSPTKHPRKKISQKCVKRIRLANDALQKASQVQQNILESSKKHPKKVRNIYKYIYLKSYMEKTSDVAGMALLAKKLVENFA